VENYKETVAPMREIVNNTVKQSTSNNTRLKDCISDIQTSLHSLDQHEEVSTISISKTFNMLRKKLKTRENELLKRLNNVVETKRTLLLTQLSSLTEILEENKHALLTSELLLKSTENTTHLHDSMYLVSAAETVEFHTDTLSEQINDKINSLFIVNHDVKVEFLSAEVSILNSIILSLGGVVFIEDQITNTINNTTTNTTNTVNNTINDSKSSEIDKPFAAAVDDQPVILLPEICFSVIVE
jgi:hypothetical protein